MTDVTLYHNPRCSKSRAALTLTAEQPEHVDVIEYLKAPLSEPQLRELIAKLEDPPGALVRKDSTFTELGLTENDIATSDQVAALLSEHPALMERPVIVKGKRAIIGRPTERVAPFLAAE